MTLIKTLHIEEKGLDKFLGSHEALIMLAVWSGYKSLSSIHRFVVRSGRDAAYSSTVTVILRLVDKGLILRKIDPFDETSTYIPAISQTDFIRTAICEIITALHTDYPLDTLYAADTISLDLDHIKE